MDGTTLVQRSDDSEAVFIERMKTFEAQTAPVIEHYRSPVGRFEVDGSARSSRSMEQKQHRGCVEGLREQFPERANPFQELRGI